MPNSTRGKARRKSTRKAAWKPWPDFPLSRRKGENRFCKKVRGKLEYFSGTAEEAEKEWQRVKDDLYAGRPRRPIDDGRLEVRGLLNKFLESKLRLYESGEIIKRSFDDYKAVCDGIAEALGKNRAVADLRPEDFERLRAEAAKRLGPTTLGVWVSKVRTVFKYGFDADLLERPVKFGPHFKAPGSKARRALREEKGERVFTPDELHALLEKAPVNLRAMILLGINCGFGNHDCAALPFRALDLDAGWVRFARPKNGIRRRCPLWPETIEALRAVIARRKEPADEAHRHLVFIGQRERPYVADHHTGGLGDKFTRFSKKVGVYRPGMSFYALRHTFETIAGAGLDQVAVDFIMGHSDASMAGAYRERIDDDRLVKVTEHVHAWLYGKGKVAR